MAILLRRSSLRTLPAPASGPATPALVQHISLAYLCFNGAGSGDDFVRYLPNAVSAGNGIILGVSYQHGVSPTISDNNGNTWGAAVKTQDGGSATDGTQAGTSLFYLQNANAGLTQFKMHFGATVSVLDGFIAEFCNLGAFNNGVAAGNQTAPNLACGSFTPGNNDANGGNLIIAYYAPFATITGSMTGWSPGGSFSLLHGDFSGTTTRQRPHSAEYFLQTTSASINPGVTASGSTDSFNCVAIAIKVANAGSPRPTSGKVWIGGIFTHAETQAPPNPLVMKCPLIGTDTVIFSGLAGSITGVTDSDNGSWTKVTSGASIGEMWYSSNNSPSPNRTINIAGGATFSTRVIDVCNVDHNSAPVTSLAAADCSNVSAISNAPSITPGVTSGMALAFCPLGNGPVFSVTSPTGAVPDMGLYTGETDIDTLDNADGVAHYSFTSSPGTLNFNWTIFNFNSNNYGAVAISFKAA